MPPRMVWLVRVVLLAIAPVFLGSLFVLAESPSSVTRVGGALGLVLLGVIHVAYWWRPWPSSPRRALVAAGGMVLINFVLLNLLGLPQPLLWLYPALIIGAGLPAASAAVGIAPTALAASAPTVRGGLLVDPLHAVEPFGTSHSILLSIVLAGLGMTAVRQLIAVNADLHATRAELADLAVAGERERLSREVHDLLGRTLSLIAVKAELASRLAAKGDPSADDELGDVQRLARQAVRDGREAITGSHSPSMRTELRAAEAALRTAGIRVSITTDSASIDPLHETTVAMAIRESVTNVLKHSGARSCRIALESTDDFTSCEVEDDGRGPVEGVTGTGLDALAERIQALGGSIEFGPRKAGGFRFRVQLDSTAVGRLRHEGTP